MTRLFAFLVSLSLGAIGATQEPPKPGAPKPEDKKAEAKKAEAKDEKPAEGDEVDVQKTAERIAENAQKAGDRLKEKDPGEDTRKIQQEILKDIDALLKKAQQPPQSPPDMPPPMSDMPPPPKSDMPPMPKDNMGQGGGSPPPNAPMPKGSSGQGGGASQPKGNPGGGGGRSKGKADRRPRRERRPRGDSPMPMGDPMANAGQDGMKPMPAGPEPKDGPMEKDQQGASATGAKFGQLSPKRQNDKLADLYKDVWGTLPDRLRQEMDLYYREQFMPRYSELLRQYYAALAEQRKKGTEDR
jgi:hypothetical protein